MAKAENGLYKDDVSLDNLEQTIKIYKNVEDNTEYNGIKASNRKKQLNKAKSIVKVMGKREQLNVILKLEMFGNMMEDMTVGILTKQIRMNI